MIEKPYNLKLSDKDLIINIICEYIDVIYSQYTLPSIKITNDEWDFIFNSVYYYLKDIYKDNEYFGVLYVTLNNVLSKAFIHNKEITYDDFANSLDEIKYLKFNGMDIEKLKGLLHKRENSLQKVVYLNDYKNKKYKQ